MLLMVRVDAPITEAESMKEIIASAMEQIAPVRVLQIRDDGYGRQESFVERKDQEGQSQKTMQRRKPWNTGNGKQLTS